MLKMEGDDDTSSSAFGEINNNSNNNNNNKNNNNSNSNSNNSNNRKKRKFTKDGILVLTLQKHKNAKTSAPHELPLLIINQDSIMSESEHDDFSGSGSFHPCPSFEDDLTTTTYQHPKQSEEEEEDLFFCSNGNGNGNHFVLSSGRWDINQDSQQGTQKLTIDKEFEQYFSMLML